MQQPKNQDIKAAEQQVGQKYDKTLIMIKSSVLALGIVFVVLLVILLTGLNKKSSHKKPESTNASQIRYFK